LTAISTTDTSNFDIQMLYAEELKGKNSIFLTTITNIATAAPDASGQEVGKGATTFIHQWTMSLLQL
jgi:hypothetical protein